MLCVVFFVCQARVVQKKVATVYIQTNTNFAKYCRYLKRINFSYVLILVTSSVTKISTVPKTNTYKNIMI